MDKNTRRPFGGIFDYPRSVNAAVTIRAFHADDLSASAAAALVAFDDAVEAHGAPECVFLTTVELDMDAGRFPDLVAAFFSAAVDDRHRYFLEAVLKDDAESTGRTGRLTFEGRRGLLQRILGVEGGYRWGSALSVGGVRVHDRDVPAALLISPFRRDGADALARIATFGCACSNDLDELWVWQA